ncbi:glycerate kinase [[Clostridium] innocuum]|nr:glycerate kinase [[Clostridium] innocuum]
MNVLIAMDSFKGALSSEKAGKALERGILRISGHQTTVCNVADGGEGSVRALAACVKGNYRIWKCRNAFHQRITVRTLLFEEEEGLCCAVEAADIFGLHNCAVSSAATATASTYGLGELLNLLHEHAIHKVLLFLGGTITTDGGLGVLQGLGIRLYDRSGNLLPTDRNPLFAFDHWDEEAFQTVKKKLCDMKLLVGCDVRAPLYGKEGCVYTYSAQKGADAMQMHKLEQQLHVLEQRSARKLMQEGCGAGGGCAAGLYILGAELTFGYDLINRYVHLEQRLRNADLVITGEGQMNHQTLQGKLPIRIAQAAKKESVPVLAVCGQREVDCEALTAHFQGIFTIQQGIYPLNEAMAHTEEYLEETGYQLMRMITMATGMRQFI